MDDHEVDQMKMPDGSPIEAQPQWRQDFPVGTGPSDYVARRDFIKFLVLTSGAFVVGHMWIGFQAFQRRLRGKPPARRIAAVSDIPVGGVLSFRYPDEAGDTCILIRPDEQTFLAYDQKCTHLSCPVLPRVKEKKLICPCHEGSFDMSTGRPVGGPPRRPLPRIVVEIHGNEIYATGVELRT